MSSDTQFWQHSKRPLSQFKLKEPLKPEGRGRDFIFRVVLPLVLVFVALFYLSVVRPDAGEFYMKWAASSSLRHVLAI